MADVHSKDQRSYYMSQIKSKDTKPEILVRKHQHNSSLRFSLHVKDLLGKPDIVLPKFKTVVNVHGCFWHGHDDCKYFKIPETNSKWWLNKISRTKERDDLNERRLLDDGWNVITIFECEVKHPAKDYMNSIINQIKGN
jgi:DNA mismatch endonuclease, patch repair protein